MSGHTSPDRRADLHTRHAQFAVSESAVIAMVRAATGLAIPVAQYCARIVEGRDGEVYTDSLTTRAR